LQQARTVKFFIAEEAAHIDGGSLPIPGQAIIRFARLLRRPLASNYLASSDFRLAFFIAKELTEADKKSRKPQQEP